MELYADYQRELEAIRQAFGYDFLALALVEPAEQQYVIRWKYAAGNRNERFRRIMLQSGKGIAGIVFKTGKSVFIPSVPAYVGADSLFNYPIVQSEKLESLGAVPLWNDARVAGVLLAGFREEGRMTPELMQALEQAARSGIGELDGREVASN
ncbi:MULTISPECIES: GAF domain-containing protein [Saccharibacillus]|uniref:GAF domain-containing protein n=1 Tax=Saccharibacillus brassicae TaxID=2583377 RepID=A0A4Y6V402_SACBS|nr:MULTISPECIES: GAF domain-containing protein [Saccharibacillus]MWJ30471.1 GAF domain-containing protein [Saccharibacillus sp. WB 17]QDH23296.1 GAF domain-containing protein [Saccharibacillus brassicae]